MTTTRLTPAQQDALCNVATGTVHLDWPMGAKPPTWRMGKAWQPLRAQAYTALRTKGLIRVLPAEWKQSEVVLTDEGHRVLEALSKGKKP